MQPYCRQHFSYPVVLKNCFCRHGQPFKTPSSLFEMSVDMGQPFAIELPPFITAYVDSHIQQCSLIFVYVTNH